ncbi:MAG: hypothetical protein OEW29_13430 [Acidimicrobiia bacterium]|nr:hypothetical protein [Acidimicrobiia bacterium]MDH4363393.1 hypothetical protein [Acidimicrobiia bacterium]
MSTEPDVEGWAAVGDFYHRYLTGLVLALVLRQGTDRATEVTFRTFRRQHLDKFLPGLAKLGIDHLPPAVACAQYHVLSNTLGGVRVEWIPETDTKSWVRYLPPRWIFDGTAVCGIPTEVSRAMLRGWHAHSGVSLGNPRLGFVCTMMTTDGQPGLEGYYVEEPEPLAPEDRLRFRPGDRPPNPAHPLPLPDWSGEHLARVERNYAMTYVASILPEMAAVLGPADAGAVGRTAARQIAMQYHQSIMGRIDPAGGQPFAHRFARLLAAHGGGFQVTGPDPVGDGAARVGLTRAAMPPAGQPPEVFEAWNGLWEGLAAMEGIRLTVVSRLDLGDPATGWEIRPA